MASVARSEAQVEVHKYYSGSIIAVAFLALALQAFLPKYFPSARLLGLPLLVTIYFALGRRNPCWSLLFGALIGLVEDAASHVPLGMNGIALTLVGYCASSFSVRIDVEHPLARVGLVFAFYYLNQLTLAAAARLLLGRSQAFFPPQVWLGSFAAAALAAVLFPQLDRLRKSA
jgi:rod shape-determining protein MreD